jgi:hypothetical protein
MAGASGVKTDKNFPIPESMKAWVLHQYFADEPPARRFPPPWSRRLFVYDAPS